MIENARALVEYLNSVCFDVRRRERLMKIRGENAQKLLDVFKMLLDVRGLSGRLRYFLLVTIQRLSNSSGLYPTCRHLLDTQLTSGDPITTGAFADVHRGHLRGHDLCMKIIQTHEPSDVRSLLKVLAPKAVQWNQLSDRNLLPFYGLYLYKEQPCLIYAWMTHGNMDEFLHHRPSANRRLLVSDIASGLAYLHENGIVHGGLKGTNIFVDDTGRARIADFGINAIHGFNAVQRSQDNSFRWRAPELLDAEADTVVYPTKNSDVYAFACVAYQALSYDIPFSELVDGASAVASIKSGSRPSRPDPSSRAWSAVGLTEDLWTLMEACWRAEPENRPDIHYIIIEHGFGNLSDDRPKAVHGVLSPAEFRDMIDTEMTLPSFAVVSAILDRIPPVSGSRSSIYGQDTLGSISPSIGQPPSGPRKPKNTAKRPSLSSTEQPSGGPCEPRDIMKRIITRLDTILSNVQTYRKLLHFRSVEAQGLLDTFQTLLDLPDLDFKFRRNLLVATQRLARGAHLFPMRFALTGVELASEHPAAAGGFADIYEGSFHGRSVCLKVIRVYQKSHTDEFLRHFSAEAILWAQLSHPNLLPNYGLFSYNARPCLVSPWMKNGDINNFLRQKPDANRNLLVLDIASGVAYLHSQDIIHGDLKGANILVSDSGRACLGDFGLSSVTDPSILHWTSNSSAASKGGSVRWQAPELLDYTRDESAHNSKPSDVYAFTSVVYEILVGVLPFFEYLRDPVVIARVQAGEKPSRPPPSSPAWGTWGLTESLWSLMEAGWRTNPDDRPTIDEILSQHKEQAPEDTRSTVNTEKISSARFRNSIGARSKPPDFSAIEALLTGILSE